MRTWTERRSRPGRRPLPQNEPNSAQWYPACTWTPEGLAQFVAYLGPEMRKRGVEVWLGTIERADPEMWDRMDVPQDSEGARLIIEEARKCSPERPLFVCMGGPLTDVSSALLLAPYITEDGRYDFSRAGRAVRVYTRIDTYLMFKDMEDRLAVQ